MMKKPTLSSIVTLLGLLMVIVGAAVFLDIVRSRQSNLALTPPAGLLAPTPIKPVNTKTYVTGQPSSLSIPSLGLNLPVIPGVYNPRTKTWTLTTDKVQYATITPAPNNEMGNTFLYGHYRSNVFASLHNLPANAQAIVTTDNGHTFYYQLTGVAVVNPDDSVGVFKYQGKPILTIQTCTGIFFQQRQLFTFNLVKVA